MPISGPKNRTIRRKLGPNKKPLPGSETVAPGLSREKVKTPSSPGRGENKPVSQVSAPGKERNEPELSETTLGKESNGLEPAVTPQSERENQSEPPITPTGGVITGMVGENPHEEVGSEPESPSTSSGGGIGAIGKGNPPVQRIEKIFHHEYIPKRSKWWWVKYLCCLLIIALLAWIIWCLYDGCPCKNSSINETRTVYVEQGVTTQGKNINNASGENAIDTNATKQTSKIMETNATQGAVQNTDKNESNDEVNASIPLNNFGREEAEENNKSKHGGDTLSSKNTLEVFEKERYQEKVKHLEGFFRARVLPKNIEPRLKTIEQGKVEYLSVDGKSYKESLDSFTVVPYEVTIKDYFYFANRNPGNYPEFWDNSSNDVRKSLSSKYLYSCLEAECPIIGISAKNAENYVKWLNRRVTDGHYDIMTEAQWHHFASFSDLEKEVWFQGNSAGKTHDVMSKSPNLKGIYDSYGNVAEIVRSKDGYVVVGGSWQSPQNELKMKYRIKPTDKDNWFGLRLIKIQNKKDKK